jgi:hypothetical protein
VPEEVEIVALHPTLNASQAYVLLRDAFSDAGARGEVLRSVRMGRRPGGRRLSLWEMRLEDATVRWSQYEELDPANHRVVFRQRDGDPVELAGEWSAGRAPAGCCILFECEVELGTPALSAAFARRLRGGVAARLEALLGSELSVRAPRRRTWAVAGI